MRSDDERDWLQSILSVEKLQQLLGKDDQNNQCESPNLRAVQFLPKEYLDRVFNSTSSFDSLNKNLFEYVRYRYIDIPVMFLKRVSI